MKSWRPSWALRSLVLSCKSLPLRWLVVSVSLCCYNKIPPCWGDIKHQTFTTHSSGGCSPGSGCQQGQVLDEDPLPGLQTAAFSPCPHLEDKESTGVSSQKGTNPVMGAPPSGPHHLTKASTSYHHQFGVRASIHGFWEDTSIQPTALVNTEGLYYGLNCIPLPLPPSNSYVEDLTPNVAALRDEAFKEVTKVNWGHKVGPWSHRTGVLIRKDQYTNTCRKYRHK